MPALADDLNTEQRAVVEHDGARPLLVVAGAGTGKTHTLATRVARLVQGGADPQRVLLVTFSRRAAASMQHRVALQLQQALGVPVALPWAGTFHSIGARLLRLHAAAIGLAPTFTVLDRADAEELMGLVRQQLGLHRAERRFPLAATCLSLASRCVNGRLTLATLVEQELPWCEGWLDELHALLQAYADEKQRQQLLDYDDLLLYWQLMAEEPRLAAALSARYDHVLVDEYQDTNPLQQRIVSLLAPQGRGLVVVGDDAQAIYAFRGADVRGMLGFQAQFEPPAAVATLEQNYRSTPQILAAANAVIARAREGLPKLLRSDRADAARPRLVTVLDEAAEARWVVDEVLRQREQGLKLRRQAVLFRSGPHSARLELELSRRNVPFVKYGGLRFLEASHVKDLLALLRWAANPRAELAGLRAARLVPGVGPATARRVVQEVAGADAPLEALAAYTPPAAVATAWHAFESVVRALADATAPWPGVLADAIAWYLPQLQRLHDDARVRAADLEQLRVIAAGFPSRDRFLTELALDPPQATSDESADPLRDEDYLILSTIHSAKGQEWSAVTVLKAVDGCMPADLATGRESEIEEERRLLYVAVTRARDQLNVMVPQRFHVTQQRHLGDRHLYASLTRFIPPEVAACFDAVSGDEPVQDDTRDAAPTGDAASRGITTPVVDVARLARQHWAR